MAPTICSDDDFHTCKRIRDTRRQLNITRDNVNPSSSSSVVSYAGGKITHRRSIAARNAKSIKFSLKNYDDNAGMHDSSDSNDYYQNSNDIIINNSVQLPSSGHSNSQYVVIKEEIQPAEEENSNLSTISDISSSSSLLLNSCDRLTSPASLLTIGQFGNSNNSYQHQKQRSHPYYCQERKITKTLNHFSYKDYSSNECKTNVSVDSLTSSRTQSPNEIVISPFDDDNFDVNEAKIKMILQQKLKIQEKTGKNDSGFVNTKGLVEIAMKTIKLIRRNQMLQMKLHQLQLETKEFIQSVMANPENRALCNKNHMAGTDELKIDERQQSASQFVNSSNISNNINNNNNSNSSCNRTNLNINSNNSVGSLSTKIH